MLIVSSTHLSLTRQDKRDGTSMFMYRGQAMQALSKALADPVTAVSDENIAAVINLAGHEVGTGV